MEYQPEEFERKLTKWYSKMVFYPAYRNYAIVIINRPILWKKDQMFKVWEKAVVTVTVNGGTYQWVKYLMGLNIDVYDSGKYNQYVPHVIIVKNKDRILPGAPPNLVDRLEELGSTVDYLPYNDLTNYGRLLARVANVGYYWNIKLYEMYVFAQIMVTRHETRDADTLGMFGGSIENIKIILVGRDYFMWMLNRGFNKIYVGELEERNKLACGVRLFYNCSVSCVSTSGLQRNINNASLEELRKSPMTLQTTFDNKDEVIVNTDAPII